MIGSDVIYFRINSVRGQILQASGGEKIYAVSSLTLRKKSADQNGQNRSRTRVTLLAVSTCSGF